MGNQLAAPARVQPGELLASDVPHLVYKDSLGGGRFLKTFLTRHEEGQRGGLVVVKVYLKRGTPGTGGGLDPTMVQQHERELQQVRQKLLIPPPAHLHAWPFQRELETDRAVYLMRQYLHSTLYDRVSTRPFLTLIEKKWLAFQLLHGLADCHDRNVFHGDVKLENVLVTSWGWAFLTDFATFKPRKLPADNPADYSFFFDTGGRRRCYVAPERFRDANSSNEKESGNVHIDSKETDERKDEGASGATDEPSETVDTDDMARKISSSADASNDPQSSQGNYPYDPAAADVFSLGCALGELFLDGFALFDLSQLLAYRRGEFDPTTVLQTVSDKSAHALIMAMIHVDPARRPTARQHLERCKQAGMGGVSDIGTEENSSTPFFPKYFDTLHDFGASLMTRDADQTAEAVTEAFEPLLADIAREEGGVGADTSCVVKSEASEKNKSASEPQNATDDDKAKKTEHMMRDIDVMMADIGELLQGDTGGNEGMKEMTSTENVAGDFNAAFPSTKIQKSIPNPIRKATPDDTSVLAECITKGTTLPGAVLVASVVCSCVRGAVRPSLRRDALGLLSRVASVADDDTRLQLIVPFCVASAADGAACVRAAAVKSLAETTHLVETFPASDAKVFPEFVWPSLLNLARDREESVRVAYAASLASLAKASVRFLQRANQGSEDVTDGTSMLSMSAYEDDLASLRALVKGVVLDYLTPGSVTERGGRSSLGQSFGGSTHGSSSYCVFPSPAFVRGAADVSRAVVASGGVADSNPDSTTGDTDPGALDAGANANATEKRMPTSNGASGQARVPQFNAFGRPPATPTVQTRGNHLSNPYSEVSPPPVYTIGSPSLGSFNAGGIGGNTRHTKLSDTGPSTRAAVLAGADSLAVFFGRQDANDYLVPLLITCLNDKSWTLRAAFFEKIAKVGRFVGISSTEAFLLPCVERCLADDSDEVAAAALACLGDMCGADLDELRKLNSPNNLDASATATEHLGATLRKRSVLAAAVRAAPALCHPAGAVRASAARFFEAAAKRLGAADAYALLLPTVRPFLSDRFASLGAAAADVLMDRTRLATATRAPPTRDAFDAAVVSAGGAPRSRHRRSASGTSGASIDLTNGDALDDLDANKINENSTADERATLEAMYAYIRALASARRGAERDPASSRSLVAGGLTPAAVAAKRADAAAAALAAERERKQTSVMRGGLFGNQRVFGVDRRPTVIGGLLKPPESAEVTVGTSENTAVVPQNKIFIDDDAWAETFGSRAPPLVPPHAPLVAPQRLSDLNVLSRTHRTNSGTSSSRRRSLEVSDVSLDPDSTRRALTQTPGSIDQGQDTHVPPETGTLEHLTAMAKGLNLGISGSEKAGPEKPLSTGDLKGVTGRRVGVPFPSTPVEYASGASDDPWAPRGVLVAHLREHRRPVRALTTSQDGLFFVSGGDDGECKLWDCGRLERDVSFRSRLTYASQGGKVTALLAGAGHQHAVASASDDGSVHVWRVEYVERRKEGPAQNSNGPLQVERYTGAAETRQVHVNEGAVSALVKVSPNVLCFATARGGFHGWDLRAPPTQEAWRVRVPPRLGLVTCAVAGGGGMEDGTTTDAHDQRWVAFGTAAGVLGLTDVRFGVVASAWRHPGGAAAPVDAVDVARGGVGQTGHACPLVWAAAGEDEVALWDVASGACVRALKVNRRRGESEDLMTNGDGSFGGHDISALSHGGAAGKAPSPSHQSDWSDSGSTSGFSATAAYRIAELRDAPPTSDGTRCIHTLPNGAILTGGSDACVRLWTPGDASKSRVVCGPLAPHERPRYEESFVHVGGEDEGFRDSVPENESVHEYANGTSAVLGSSRPVRSVAVLRERPAAVKAHGGHRGRSSLGDTTSNDAPVSVAETVALAAVRHDCHRDSVLAMAVAGVGTARALVTCGRDAAVKVWK